jgi:chitinase
MDRPLMSPSDKIVIALFLFAQTAAAIKFFFRLEKRLDKIEYQLYNNGGESMKDAVDRIEIEIAVLKTKLEK